MKHFVLLAGAALQLCAQAPLNHPDNPVAGDALAIEAGRKAFVNTCAGCHGATGEGGRGPSLRDGRVIRRSTDFQMFTTIQKGIAGTDMPGVKLPDRQIWELVAFVRALGLPAGETIVPGDATRGERVYAANGCANCHMLSGRGGSLGPDLSNAGGSRSYEYLRESIIKPAERIVAGYQRVSVKLKDGRSIDGIARNFTNYDFQIQGRDGKLYLLEATEVADVKVSVATYMPQDYGKKIGRDEMTDLLAFLAKQSVRPQRAKGAK